MAGTVKANVWRSVVDNALTVLAACVHVANNRDEPKLDDDDLFARSQTSVNISSDTLSTSNFLGFSCDHYRNASDT
ncbi:hypothetical protein Btru_044777 [Bulinus truncatus]|nr:hypothetical protein Btru_044777 [Bulinus truncatus]